jgi:hypothetical protein
MASSIVTSMNSILWYLKLGDMWFCKVHCLAGVKNKPTLEFIRVEVHEFTETQDADVCIIVWPNF